MSDLKVHLVKTGTTAFSVLGILEKLKYEAVLFVVDENNCLIGSLIDTDIRRGLLKGLTIEENVEKFVQPNPVFLRQGVIDINQVKELRTKTYKIIPIINQAGVIVDILNFAVQKSLLPITVLLMAGGEGRRLRPLTQNVPKPLLKVGDKSIIEHNLTRLSYFGIKEVFISVNYLANMIVEQIGDGSKFGLNIKYIHEKEQLGTMGALSLISEVRNKIILVQNSDLLTDVDLENLYLHLQSTSSDLSILGIPYNISVPYAVLEEKEGYVTGFTEKPTYSYYCNGGFYLFRKELKELIPHNTIYNATDLIDQVIAKGKRISVYPHHGYWLDIGKHEDFSMAQRDIRLLGNRWL